MSRAGNFRFLSPSGTPLDVRVVAEDGAFSNAVDLDLAQAPGLEAAFLTGSGRETGDTFEITVFLEVATQAAARTALAALYEAARAAVSLARIAVDADGSPLGVRASSTTVLASSSSVLASSATEVWYRALAGDGLSVADVESEPIGPSGRRWYAHLTLRPLFAAATTLPARTSGEYASLVGSAIVLPPILTSALLTEDGKPILTERGEPILIAPGWASAIVTPPAGRLDYSTKTGSQYTPLLGGARWP